MENLKSFQLEMFSSTKLPSTNPDKHLSEGMGANCAGVETRGKWSLSEKALYINSLELLAGESAILTFPKNKQLD